MAAILDAGNRAHAIGPYRERGNARLIPQTPFNRLTTIAMAQTMN
jgi:hypothetical protein